VREGTGKQWGSHSLFIRLKRFLNSVLSGFFFLFLFSCV
jgi:IS4 transposase